MSKPFTRSGIFMALQALLSFRVVMALTTSTSVTAAVAGPMAYQASKARERPPAAVAAPTTTTTGTTTTTAPPAVTTVVAPTTTVVATTVPGATTTTLPPLVDTGLFVSPNADHSRSEVLQGASVFGTLYLYFDGPGVTAVKFWVDDPTGGGAPTRVATAPPFDLAPAMFDVTGLGVGRHTLLAEVSTTAAGAYRRLAVFTVATKR